MNRSFAALGSVLAALLVACAIGCSGSTADVGVGDDGGGTHDGGGGDAASAEGGGNPDGGTTSDSSTQDASPTADGGSVEGGGDQACKMTTTKADCNACCGMNHSAGVATINAAIVSCGCEQSNCKTACGPTLCAQNPAPPDQPCDNCLGPKIIMGGACYQPILTACQQSPDCVAYFQCAGMNGASCGSKP